MKRLLICLLVLCLFLPAAQAQEYPDGIYRGFYYDGGIEQISIQFQMEEGLFVSIVYRGVKYKDGDYMIEDASDAQKATLAQYEQMADYLIGKGTEAISDLYSPYDIVHDVDAVTSATVQSSKLISALWDGLNRRPFKLIDTSKLPEAETYQDGWYRGSYMEGGSEEVAVEFRLTGDVFGELSYRALQYKGEDYLADGASEAVRLTRGQFEQLLAYLDGRPMSAVNELYQPGNMVTDTDASAGATIRAPKVISAIWDALNRHAYRVDDE